MDWESPFVIYRVTPEGEVQAVYQASDLKDAKYWLQYIAEPGDVLTKTPAHPRYNDGSGEPTYWSHKEKSGKPITNKEDWESYAKGRNWSESFLEAVAVEVQDS